MNLHSCTTRVVLKMIAEHSNGTILTPFLNEFNRAPRFISIVDIFEDLISSGLISTTELLVYSRQDIIVKMPQCEYFCTNNDRNINRN